MKLKKISLIAVVIFISFVYARSESGDFLDGWKIVGKAHIIPYWDARDFSNETRPLTFTSSKLRFGVEKDFGGDVIFNMQVQDSRIFGEEGSVTKNGKNVDLIIGYLRVKDIFGSGVDAQIGRFQALYGDARFIGDSPWNFVERAFDGVRFIYEIDKLNLHVWHIIHTADIGEQIRGAVPGKYDYPIEANEGYNITGGWANYRISENHSIDFGAFTEQNRKPDTLGQALARNQIAGEYAGKFGDFSTKLEAGYQFGKSAGRDVSAYLFGIKGTYIFNTIFITAGLDVASGTPPDETDEVRVWDPTLGAKHKFWGRMDYFSDIAGGTAGLGLIDPHFEVGLSQKDAFLIPSMEFHNFMSAQESESGKNYLGTEIDLKIRRQVNKYFRVDWVSGVFFPGELSKEIWAVDPELEVYREDPGFCSYLRLRLDF